MDTTTIDQKESQEEQVKKNARKRSKALTGGNGMMDDAIPPEKRNFGKDYVTVTPAI
jgi:hypothetical protein